MWRRKLLQFILKISYYNVLLIAVLAAPMDFNTYQLHPSRTYTIYCAIMHFSYLAITPATFTSYMYERSYMSGMPVLQWVYTIANASSIFVIIVFIAGFWMRRAFVIACCKSIENFRWRYRHRLRSIMPGSMQANQKIERIMLAKYCITNVNSMLGCYIFFRMSPIHEIGFLHAAATSTLLTLFLAAIIDQFCNIMTQLWMHFECVNQSLHSVILQLKALDHALSLGASEMLVRHRARSLQRDLTDLNNMHHYCFQLTQRFFEMSEIVAAFVTVKVVLNNISNLYHAVLFNNRSLTFDPLTYLTGCLLVVAFYVDTIMLINVLDALLKAGNKPGMLLHECGDLLQLRRCIATKLTQSLDQFSLELTCRRLSYSICGLFNLDRQMGLKCLVTAIVQTTVLMQYDLKSKIILK